MTSVCDKIDRVDGSSVMGEGFRRTGAEWSPTPPYTSRGTGVEGSIDILTVSCPILDDSTESGVAAPCIMH